MRIDITEEIKGKINEVKKRSSLLSKGEWGWFYTKVNENISFCPVLVEKYRVKESGVEGGQFLNTLSGNDRDFFMHSQEDVPFLLDVIESLNHEIWQRDITGDTKYVAVKLTQSKGANGRLKGENKKLRAEIRRLNELLAKQTAGDCEDKK